MNPQQAIESLILLCSCTYFSENVIIYIFVSTSMYLYGARMCVFMYCRRHLAGGPLLLCRLCFYFDLRESTMYSSNHQLYNMNDDLQHFRALVNEMFNSDHYVRCTCLFVINGFLALFYVCIVHMPIIKRDVGSIISLFFFPFIIFDIIA